MRFKIIKKITTCKVTHLHKIDQFRSRLRVENTLMATLPPVGEMDVQLHRDLLTVLQQCVESETQFQNELLPRCVDAIKTTWYENTRTIPEIFSIPDTDSDNILSECCEDFLKKNKNIVHIKNV